jgi:hypothetical protein
LRDAGGEEGLRRIGARLYSQRTKLDNQICTTMKILFALFSLIVIGALAVPAVAADKPAKSKKLQHVVAFKFKSTATPAQIKQVEDAFRALKQKIPQIKSLEWGTNVSPEKHDKGFTHGFVLSFKTDKDRDAYLVHPDHKAFGSLVGPVLEDVFVIDFWAQD